MLTADAHQYCMANPKDMLPSIDNCALYFNCSVFGSSASDYVKECTYPDLFSVLSFTCQDFTTVHCSNRSEPQAPCKCILPTVLKLYKILSPLLKENVFLFQAVMLCATLLCQQCFFYLFEPKRNHTASQCVQ